jgi:CRP/FNR family transcriptional regulator, nitrogen oxide reductase regulator
MPMIDRTTTRSPLFAGLGAEELNALERGSTPRRFAPGESLYVQGAAARELFLITKGQVKIARALENGTALLLTILGPGQPVGILGATESRANHATATAATSVETVAWPLAPLRRLMEGSAVLTGNVLRAVTTYAEQMVLRLEEAASVPVEQRLARTLLRMVPRLTGTPAVDGCEMHLSRQDLSELTSATLPTISRTMSRWRRHGIIGGTRGRVRLLDHQALVRVAQFPDG